MGEQADYMASPCAHGLKQRVGQSVRDGKLVWSRSVLCGECGRLEEDGDGFPPDFVQTSLIIGNGKWSVLFEQPTSPEMARLLLRKILNADPEAVRGFNAKSPIIFSGTRTEAEWLVEKLRLAGRPARMKQGVLRT